MFFVEISRVLNEAGFKKAPTREMPNILCKTNGAFYERTWWDSRAVLADNPLPINQKLKTYLIGSMSQRKIQQ